MNVTHSFAAIGECPVNGAPDHYEIQVLLWRFMLSEEVKAKAVELLQEPTYQEAFTDALATALTPATVTTVCRHGDVRTVVEVTATARTKKGKGKRI